MEGGQKRPRDQEATVFQGSAFSDHEALIFFNFFLFYSYPIH